MGMDVLIQLIKDVLRTKEVIGVAIAVVFYLNFIFFIVRYRKRPKPVAAPKRRSKPAASAPAAGSGDDAGDSTKSAPEDAAE